MRTYRIICIIPNFDTIEKEKRNYHVRKKQEFHGSDLEKVEAYYGIKKKVSFPLPEMSIRSEFLLC